MLLAHKNPCQRHPKNDADLDEGINILMILFTCFSFRRRIFFS